MNRRAHPLYQPPTGTACKRAQTEQTLLPIPWLPAVTSLSNPTRSCCLRHRRYSPQRSWLW